MVKKVIIYLNALSFYRLNITTFLIIIFISFNSLHSLEAEKVYDEYKVKAGFIFNFIKFTNFKKLPKNIEICLKVKKERINEFLPLTKKTISESNISITSINNSTNLNKCSVIFISKEFLTLESKVLKKINNKNVLTIGESKTFLNNGGLINFYQNKGKLRFAISKKELDNLELKISSKLLRIALLI